MNLTTSDDKTETSSARRSHSSVLYDRQMVMFGGYDGNNYNTTLEL